MKLFAFFAFLAAFWASAHAQTATGMSDEHCTITAPEGGYAELRYGQPWLDPETLEAGVTYTYQTAAQEICGLEICYTDIQEHSKTLHFSYDASWQAFLTQTKDWTGFYPTYLSIGLELVPGYDEPTNEYGQDDRYFGEPKDHSPLTTDFVTRSVVRFVGTYNICDNLRVQLVAKNSEGICSADGNCDGFAKTPVDISYLGNGLLGIVSSFEDTKQGLEGQDRCAAMTGNGDGIALAFALCALGLLALVSVRRVFA